MKNFSMNQHFMNLFAGVLVRGDKLRLLYFVDGCLSSWVTVFGLVREYGTWNMSIKYIWNEKN